MIDFRGKQIYLACVAMDMRKAINGLSAIVKLSLRFNCAEGILFVFCNRSRNWLKILERDEGDFWLYAECCIKPFVIGCKSGLFSCTPKGARASPVIYSVIKTAKKNSLKLPEFG